MKRKLYIFSSLLTSVLLAACGSNYVPPNAPADISNLGPGDSIPSSTDQFTPQTSQQIGSANQQIDYAPQYAQLQTQYQQQPQYVDNTDAAATYFQPQFANYGGRWVNIPGYGNCWQPANVAPDWRPYMFGHWVYTDDYGWYWVSEEQFGWATYHYGRWIQLDIGWCWVPGRLWGPAWVTWQSGDGYAGWAPLPPVRPGYALATEIGLVHPWSYCFVEDRFFFDRNVRNHYQPVTRNVTLVQNTRNITRIENVNNRFVNRGVNVAEVEKAAGTKVDRVKVRDVQSAKQAGATASTVETFRPQVPAATPRQEQPKTPTPQPRQTAQPTPPQQPRQPIQQQPQQTQQTQRPAQPTIQTPAPAPQPRQPDRAYLDQLDKEMQDRHHKERETPSANNDQINKRQENESRLLRQQQQRIAPQPQPQQPIQPQQQPPQKDPPPQKVEQPRATPPQPQQPARPNPPQQNPGKGPDKDKDKDENPGKGPKDK